MKMITVSFVVGLAVGIVCGLIRVKSPEPPIVALLGLLGMVLGEQFGEWVLARRANATTISAVRGIGERSPEAS
jgi:XapX domain-containing protein